MNQFKSYFLLKVFPSTHKIYHAFFALNRQWGRDPIFPKISLAIIDILTQNLSSWRSTGITHIYVGCQQGQMRVLLRNTKTGFYFRSAEEVWTSDDAEALDFHHSASA